MEIFSFTTLFPPIQVGGAEKSVLEINDDLVSAGHSVEIFTLSLGRLVTEIRPQGDIVVHRILRKQPYFPFTLKEKPNAIRRFLWHASDVFSPAVYKKIHQRMKINPAKLFVTHNLSGLSYAPWIYARFHKIKVIHVIHDYNLLCPRTSLWHNNSRCARICIQCEPRKKLSQMFLSQKFMILGVSQAVLEKHKSLGLFENNPTGILNGNTRMEYVPNKNSSFDFGFIGAITSAKGIDLLLKAAQSTNYSFAIAGKGSESEISKLANIPNVTYLGWQDPRDFFSKIDTLIVPSIWDDPAPKVVYEGAWAGRRVIVSDRPSLLELANYHEIDFLSFKAGDVDDLISCLNRAHQNKEPVKTPKARPSQGENLMKVIQTFVI